jgi:hypothetical protein
MMNLNVGHSQSHAVAVKMSSTGGHWEHLAEHENPLSSPECWFSCCIVELRRYESIYFGVG